MRIVVVGGAGFLGSHLCEKLMVNGHTVVCIDNLLTGRLGNVEQLRRNPMFSFIQHDVCTAFEVDGKVDYILNFASPASPSAYLKYPIETLSVGSIGTANCLRVAQRHGASFLMASTSEVYGDSQVNPQPESYWGNVNPVGPRSVYDESKRFSEALCIAYSKEFEMDVKIARIFNTYGPGMQRVDGRVIPNFICQALHHEPLTIYGDGTQTRSFCYVSDLVTGILKLMVSDVKGPINLGNPNQIIVRELAEKVLQLTSSRSKLIFLPLPQDDPKQRQPDITRAKELLNWEPEVSLDQGLQYTIAFFSDLPPLEKVTRNAMPAAILGASYPPAVG